jgi:hypothetical protein
MTEEALVSIRRINPPDLGAPEQDSQSFRNDFWYDEFHWLEGHRAKCVRTDHAIAPIMPGWPAALTCNGLEEAAAWVGVRGPEAYVVMARQVMFASTECGDSILCHLWMCA